jgi:hypothetical protein
MHQTVYKSTHTGDHHRLKSKHDEDETRKNNNTAINQMAGTRSGKTNYKVGPEHQVRNARARMSKNKRETIEPRATRFQTTEAADHQKRMRISDPSPPTPMKEELVNLLRASRHSLPPLRHRQARSRYVVSGLFFLSTLRGLCSSNDAK